MVFEAAPVLLLLNFITSSFFVGQNGSFSIEINQGVFPDFFFIDFGDNSVLNATGVEQCVVFIPKKESSLIVVSHSYEHAGRYDVFFQAAVSASRFEHFAAVVVEEKLSNVVLVLVSAPVVALLEEVTVTCTVERGTNLHFLWDFGDGSDGEYTKEDPLQTRGSQTVRTVHHSYGIANKYNVSVQISNSYESLVFHLNETIQAVELIEQLHLQPRSKEQFSAPLFKQESSSTKFSTTPVEFEACAWRGSDVEFHFFFGDGSDKVAHSFLNAWSLPCAAVKHVYTLEGQFEVSVVASNPLNSVKASLEQPFCVQLPPEDLKLGQQYYIIESGSNLTLQATVSQGTNVSYNWIVGELHINNVGNSIFLPHLSPGIHVVAVEAFNQVSNVSYGVIRKPSVSARVFVQEKLWGISICLVTELKELCGSDSFDLPLDEEVHLKAEITPSTETVLRFIWQLGNGETRRSSAPFLNHKYQQAGRYHVNVTAQNHISSVSSMHIHLNLVQRVANLTSIICLGPNLVNHPITYRAFYWFGTNLTFLWDFGDGSPPITTNSASVHHMYEEVGEYWVSVNVWNQFSHANLTTNMFFLHYVCRKPEITLLRSNHEIVRLDKAILFEAAISVACEVLNVEYEWTLKDANNNVVTLPSEDSCCSRQLLIPGCFLSPGPYDIHLKVTMAGTIVYAEQSASLMIFNPSPVLVIRGGLVRWLGVNDTQEISASYVHRSPSQNLNYSWNCSSLLHKHVSCFGDKMSLASFVNSASIYLSSSSIISNLQSVIVTVSDGNNQSISASQVLEIAPFPHMLQIELSCENCRGHQINQQDFIKLRAVCRNCGKASLLYQWMIWVIDDSTPRRHYGSYQCVQADGSTFFIFAPNTTEAIDSEGDVYSLDLPNDHMLSEKPHDSSRDVPPFPKLPGFPEDDENVTNQDFKPFRVVRSTSVNVISNILEDVSYNDYPFEGVADYATNSTFQDSHYPELFPLGPELAFGDPDFNVAKEGLPGEGGSAAARHQGMPNLGIISEDEDEILEGTGKPRTKTSSAFGHRARPTGDPLRDRVHKKSSLPHIVSLPRSTVYLDEDSVTSGFDSEYLILKPNSLKAGRSYLIQTHVFDPGTGLEGYAMEHVKVNLGPVKGRCTLMPVEGFALETDFRLHCLEWKSAHAPLHYELHYSLSVNDLGHLVYFGLSEKVKFNLPSGLPSSSFDVHLSVTVRDSKGASTKVCALVRKVQPSRTNQTLEQFLYNETYHPQASLKMLLGEKNNQAVLQKIHAFLASINRAKDLSLGAETYALKKRLKQRFLEIISSLKIVYHVEAVQAISVLNELIVDYKTVTLFDLQKAYNIFQKIVASELFLYNLFPVEEYCHQRLIFLSRLAFAAHSIEESSDALMFICLENILQEMKDLLSLRLEIEKPLVVRVPHLTIAALYVTNNLLELSPTIPIKNTAIKLIATTKRNQDNHNGMQCFMMFALEYDYVNHLSMFTSWRPLSSLLPSVVYLLEPCNKTYDVGGEKAFNISVDIQKPSWPLEIERVVFKGDQMNVHILNITQDYAGLSILFFIKFDDGNHTQTPFDILLRHHYHPTLKEYDMKMSYEAGTLEMTIFVPADYIESPGLFYIGMVSVQDLSWEDLEQEAVYEISVWTDVCLNREKGAWSPRGCQVLNSSTSNWTSCMCNCSEMCSVSIPHKLDLIVVPISSLVDPFYSPFCIIVLMCLLMVCFVLLYLNYLRDRAIHLSCSPIPLKDNDPCHKQFYLLVLKTGFYYNSGTTASVFVVLHGANSVTETRQLAGDVDGLLFQKGSVNAFLLSSERSLGPLTKLQVWHNNLGPSPSWYLKTISVQDLSTGTTHYFKCFDWLSAEIGNGLIERELTAMAKSPRFIEVFLENLLICFNELNPWNAVLLDAPASFFTGTQRIVCCLCFLLNSGFLITVFQKDFYDFSTTQSLYLKALLVSVLASVPQIIFAFLFRFSKPLAIRILSKCQDLFRWLSLQYLECWLVPKSRTNSESDEESNSSFDESTMASVQSLQEREKEAPLSNLNDPVSPLQKTLSTWQILEGWLRQRQNPSFDLELASNISKSDSSDLVGSWNSSGSLNRFQHGTPTISDRDASLEQSYLESAFDWDFSSHMPFLDPCVYITGWFLLLLDVMLIYVLVFIETLRFPVSSGIMFFKGIFISAAFSYFIVIPATVFVIALFYSTKQFTRVNRHFSSALPLYKKEHHVDCDASSYQRIKYFKNYLRPPKEAILQNFRLLVLQEKKISAFYRDLWKFAAVLVLLVVSVLHEDVRTKFLQRQSIENALFKSLPKRFSLKHQLLTWLEETVFDEFLADHFCHSMQECGLSTNSVLLGSVILRKFSLTPPAKHGSLTATSLVLSEESFHAYNDLQNFVDSLNASSAGSLEFLLFNPSTSILSSVSILCEAAIFITPQITLVTLPQQSKYFCLKIFFNLLLFVSVLFCTRNQLWKITKHKMQFWRKGSNYFMCCFIVSYFIYLTIFLLHLFYSKLLSSKVLDPQFKPNQIIHYIDMLEQYLKITGGILLFIHLLSLQSILHVSQTIKQTTKRLSHMCRINMSLFLLFILIVMFLSMLAKFVLGRPITTSFPLYGFLQATNVIFERKYLPVIENINSPFKIIFIPFLFLVIICVHLYILCSLRATLLSCQLHQAHFQNLFIPFLRKTGHVLKKKLLPFQSQCPQTVPEDQAPPVDFILYELERLADALVEKVENLFPKNDINAAEEDESQEFEYQSKSSLEDGFCLEFPHFDETSQNIFPSCFHSSFTYKAKLKSAYSPKSLQNRIRKTYPLHPFDSDISISNENVALPNNLFIRKTKSRGKIKIEDFDAICYESE